MIDNNPPPQQGPQGPVLIALVTYDLNAPAGREIRVGRTQVCKEFLETLSDIELKVFACEVGMVLRKCFEKRTAQPGVEQKATEGTKE